MNQLQSTKPSRNATQLSFNKTYTLGSSLHQSLDCLVLVTIADLYTRGEITNRERTLLKRLVFHDYEIISNVILQFQKHQNNQKKRKELASALRHVIQDYESVQQNNNLTLETENRKQLKSKELSKISSVHNLRQHQTQEEEKVLKLDLSRQQSQGCDIDDEQRKKKTQKQEQQLMVQVPHRNDIQQSPVGFQTSNAMDQITSPIDVSLLQIKRTVQRIRKENEVGNAPSTGESTSPPQENEVIERTIQSCQSGPSPIICQHVQPLQHAFLNDASNSQQQH